MFELPDISRVVAAALAEDLGVVPERFEPGFPSSPDILERDVTTFSTLGAHAVFAGDVVARQPCVVCGLPVAAAVFEALSTAAGLFEPVEFFPLVAEGAKVAAGTRVAEVEGVAAAVLAGERTALDFLMVLSGIATRTAQWVEAAGQDLAVCDTRKTIPGLRELSKYAVFVGGGTNHRAGLYDMVLIKDNHVSGSEGVADAVRRAKRAHPDLVIEAEADTLPHALEAVEAGADMVLLDNMDDDALAEATAAIRGLASSLGRRVLTEASGGVTYERVAGVRRAGVDRVSSSELTLAPPVDFGFDER